MAKSAHKHNGGSDDNTERPLIDLIRTIVTDLANEVRDALAELQTKEQERHNQIMTALETLTASVNANTTADGDLTTAVNAAIVQLGAASPTDAQLLTLASQVDANTATTQAQTKALNDALATPPPPTP